MKSTTTKADLAAFFREQRFLIVIGTLRRMGGAERQALLLGEFLKKEIGADVVFLASHGTTLLTDTLAKLGIKHVIAPFEERIANCRKAVQITRLIPVIRKIHPDVIIPFISHNSKVIGLIWKLTGAKYALWNQRDEGRGLYGSRLERLALRNVCDIVSNSHAGRDGLVDVCGVRSQDVTIINNGVVLPNVSTMKPVWRQKLGLPQNTLLVSMIANLTRYKEHSTLLRAWKIIESEDGAKNQPVALVLAGAHGETADQLKIQAFDLHVQNVFMPGSISDVHTLIHDCDLIVHSSRLEGCPNAVLEAMALAKPVIGTDIPGIRQALGEQAPAICFSAAGDATELADRMRIFIGDQSLRQTAGSANRSRIEKEFAVEKMGYEYLELIYESWGASWSPTGSVHSQRAARQEKA